jgi:hypothetical protein
MRQSIGIVAVALVAAASVWALALNHSGAKTQDRLSGGINTLQLTMNASTLPVQRYDAH